MLLSNSDCAERTPIFCLDGYTVLSRRSASRRQCRRKLTQSSQTIPPITHPMISYANGAEGTARLADLFCPIEEGSGGDNRSACTGREGKQFTGSALLLTELTNNLSARKQQLLELRLREKRAASEMKPIPRKKGSDPAPLSFGQEPLWFLDQLEPDNAVYNIPMAVRLVVRSTSPVLQRCLSEVLRRHESLRTRFEALGRSAGAGDPNRGIPGDAACRFEGFAEGGAGSGGQAIVHGRSATSF